MDEKNIIVFFINEETNKNLYSESSSIYTAIQVFTPSWH